MTANDHHAGCLILKSALTIFFYIYLFFIIFLLLL